MLIGRAFDDIIVVVDCLFIISIFKKCISEIESDNLIVFFGLYCFLISLNGFVKFFLPI